MQSLLVGSGHGLSFCLQDALDALASKIESARSKWDGESRAIETRTQQVLMEFGRDLKDQAG